MEENQLKLNNNNIGCSRIRFMHMSLVLQTFQLQCTATQSGDTCWIRATTFSGPNELWWISLFSSVLLSFFISPYVFIKEERHRHKKKLCWMANSVPHSLTHNQRQRPDQQLATPGSLGWCLCRSQSAGMSEFKVTISGWCLGLCGVLMRTIAIIAYELAWFSSLSELKQSYFHDLCLVMLEVTVHWCIIGRIWSCGYWVWHWSMIISSS